MAIPGNAVDFGKLFSEITVSHATRTTNINTLVDVVNALYYAINYEVQAETLSTDNAEIDDWDDFRGNGVSPNPSGINDDVQAKAEALWNALDALSS